MHNYVDSRHRALLYTHTMLYLLLLQFEQCHCFVGWHDSIKGIQLCCFRVTLNCQLIATLLEQIVPLKV